MKIEIWSDVVCPWCYIGRRRLGINGVPFFVLDRRYGVSGAQPADVLLQALDQRWAETHAAHVLSTVSAGAGDAVCIDATCAT